MASWAELTSRTSLQEYPEFARRTSSLPGCRSVAHHFHSSLIHPGRGATHGSNLSGKIRRQQELVLSVGIGPRFGNEQYVIRVRGSVADLTLFHIGISADER